MKLHSYSSELVTFVEAKWARAKLATVGILIGTIVLLILWLIGPKVGPTKTIHFAT